MRALCLLVMLGGLGAGCGGPQYSMRIPPAFKRFCETSDFKLITAKGVGVKAREVDNYPKGNLEFWKEALAHHLKASGYAKKDEHCFKTSKGLRGCSVDFMRPYGAQDWVISETLFVVGDRIVLVEAAGPFEHFQPIQQQLRQALKSFDPGSG